MKTAKKLKEVKMHAMTALLLFCTVVGSVGIFTAPESDKSELEQELMQNQQALQQLDTISPDREWKQGKKTAGKTKLISVIGDSVFLGAAPSFQKIQKNTVIDAKISRQVSQGIDVAKQLKKKGKLGDTVIISLGTNGKFNPATGQELINYLGKGRTIYWIAVYGKDLKWQNSVNKTIQKLVKKNKNTHLIPWDKTAQKHPDWFYQDGIHLNTKGQDGFARFVKKKIR